MDPTLPVAVIGAGTGLGEVFMTPDHNGLYEAWPSEGGHVEYAPRNQEEFELLEHIKRKVKGRVSVERVVSGKGLVNVYEYLRERYPEEVIEQYDKQIMEETSEGGKLIGQFEADYPLCRKASPNTPHTLQSHFLPDLRAKHQLKASSRTSNISVWVTHEIVCNVDIVS